MKPHIFKTEFLRLATLVLALLAVATPMLHAQTQNYTPEDLTLEQIQQAIARGVNALYDEKNAPDYTILPHEAHYTYHQHVINRYGNHAVVLWALLEGGETYQDLRLYKRLNWVLSSDSPYTYDRAMRMNMLAQLPRDRWQPWIHRDGWWLDQALTPLGNYSRQWVGQKPNSEAEAFGDHAHGQYGVLGLFAAANAGYPVKPAAWEQIDRYWRQAQIDNGENPTAGWGVFSPKLELTGERGSVMSNQRISGPMTAGGVAVLTITERMLYGDRMINPSRTHISEELRKGLAWLDENFQLDDKAEESDRYFYYWTIMRVGQATGYRTFNKVDWFRDITAHLLNEQGEDGLWTGGGSQGPLLSSSFALLYLGRALDPIAISKVRFALTGPDGKLDPYAWNNRPHDIWNFVRYAADLYEHEATWQIVDLSLPVYSLIESPMLYLATDQPFSLNEHEQRNLRDYLDAGGMLVINPDKSYGAIRRSVEQLAQQLYPQWELKEAPKDHPFFRIHQRVERVPVHVLSNEVRPLIVALGADIGEALQKDDQGRSEAFGLLSNLYLYATGMNVRRSRLQNHFTPSQEGKLTPKGTLHAARLSYSGRYDPEPGALTQLQRLLARDYQIDMRHDTVAGTELTGEHQLAFLTTIGDGTLSPEGAAGIRRWIENGGTLWVDAAGGAIEAGRHAERMIEQIMPGARIVPIAPDHPIISGDALTGGSDNRFVRYRTFKLYRSGPTNDVKLQAVFLDGRPAVIYSSDDLTCGLAGLDHWGISGYSVADARRLVVNGVLDVMGK